jgi:hypothetical protein
MAAKPFTIQSPMQLVMDYKGNKKLIAQAMTTGVVNSLSGTLAGKLIDDIRNAAQAEQAPTQTIAEQIFNPQAPPAPMGGIGMPAPPPPQGPPAGLGATPEAGQMPPMPEMPAPQMPPTDMPMPEMPQEEAPMEMAGGGIASLPIPDTMFDEPDDGSYADGGIVAFAGGGETDGERYERLVTNFIPGTTVTSRQRSAAKNAQVDGVPNSFHVDDRARDFVPPKGMSLTEFGAKVKGIPGLEGTDAVYNSKDHMDHLHLEPGGKRAAAPVPERNTRTAQGFTSNLGDITDYVERRFGKTDEEKANDEALMARAKEIGSPEYAAKEAKDSLYGALAAVGFRIAGSKAANLAEAFGEAAAAEIGGFITDKKERKQLKDKALNLMVANGAKNRKDAMERFRLALDIQQNQLAEKLSGQKLDLDERQVKVAEDKLAAEIAAAEAAGEDIKDRIDRWALDYAPGTPEHEAAMRVKRANQAPTGAGALTLEGIRNLQGGREGNTGGTAEGTTAKDSDGKTIVFSGGQWMYP